ncbi:MAG: alanine racemase [Candidatus Riflebacteria bacterium]|nr:alanine racemase [Candidatus Riflebacteria bacterium]MDD3000270.1 alanine racemase [Candidatus Riflebacteria bacterium]
MLYQTHAEVNLKNISDNITNIRKAIGSEPKILIAVKADAYGHGAVEVSKMAQEIGVDWLGIATVPEAIELREAGITLPILKLSHLFEEEAEAAINYDVTTAVSSIENAEMLNRIAKSLNKTCSVHLKIDTGMGRIGVSVDEASKLADTVLHGCSNLSLTGIFTHLPVSDDTNKTFTQRQIAKFKKCVTEIEEKMQFKFPLVHCANSGGVLAHPESTFSMVRPGIMIYGFYPSSDIEHSINLKPALSFKTRVSFVKFVTKGCSIGYGRTWIAPEDSWVATFPAGYADGFNRLFSNKGRVLINGNSYPVIGRVCMDQSMCLLGSSTDVKVGDEVVLIGKSEKEEITAYEWADKLDTITYEVTCQINKRVKRYYIKQ